MADTSPGVGASAAINHYLDNWSAPVNTPEDPLGTVRAGAGLLAIRAHTQSSDDELSWFIVDIGFAGDLRVAEIEGVIGTWPIVYQP